jgi:2,3-diketo-5-methylthiopentyl-1-phosphate enolase
MFFETQTFELPDGIDPEEHVIATYYLGMKAGILDVLTYSSVIAIEQSTGTWTPVPEETPEVRKKYVAKVIGMYEVPYYEDEVPNDVKERAYIIQIAYKKANFGNQIPMMLTTVIGNISMMPKLKLLDLRFPKSYLAGFQGPKFGIEGVRKLLKVPKRPLLNNMIKPCTGFTPKVGQKLFYEAAAGGADIIKDDELLANPEFCPLEDRVSLYMEAADRAKKVKGEDTLYTVNVTDEYNKMLENADKAIELGVNALMVNYLTVGISGMRVLAEDPSINVPILSHMDFAGAIYSSVYSGMSSHLVLAKLPRLAGADISVYPAPYGRKAVLLKERYAVTSMAYRLPLQNIKPTFPMPSGGISPATIPAVVKDLGYDCVIGSGGGIHGHPDGPTAGARAFRQAIDATMQHISLKEYAKDHKELSVAIERWGTYRGGSASDFLEMAMGGTW